MARKVPYWCKAIGWILLASVGITCVTLSIVFSNSKTYYWQITLIVNYACALAFEVFIFESVRCFFMHFFLPYYLFRDEVKVAVETILEISANLFSETRVPVPNGIILSSPKYLHVSTYLASEYPHLVESAIVKSYHSTSPGVYAFRWAHLVPPSPFDTTSDILIRYFRRVSRKAVNLFYAIVPQSVQSVVIHSILPFIVAVLLQNCKQLVAKVFVGITFGTVFLFINIIYFRYNGSDLWKSFKSTVTIARGSVRPAPPPERKIDEPQDPIDLFMQARDHRRQVIKNGDVSDYLNVSPKKYGLSNTAATQRANLSPPISSQQDDQRSILNSKSPSNLRFEESYTSGRLSPEVASFGAALNAIKVSPGPSPMREGAAERRLLKSAGDMAAGNVIGSDSRLLRSAGYVDKPLNFGNSFSAHRSSGGLRPNHSREGRRPGHGSNFIESHIRDGFRPYHSSEGSRSNDMGGVEFRSIHSSGGYRLGRDRGDYEPHHSANGGRVLHSTGGSRTIRSGDEVPNFDRYIDGTIGSMPTLSQTSQFTSVLKDIEKVKKKSRYEKRVEERAAMMSPARYTSGRNLENE